MKLRSYREADAEALAEIFTASVHALALTHYSVEQRHVWAPVPPDIAEWRERFSKLHTIVAEEGGACLGFIAYEINGHIDLLYAAPDAARRGVASALLQEAVTQVLAAGEAVALFTEASLVAAPFFRRHGFEIIEEQNVIRRGVSFRRFAMRKPLHAGH